MKVRSVYLTLLTAFVVPVAAAGADRSNQSTAIQTFTGEIMDLLCAGYKGHDYMMQQMKSIGSDKKTCINRCLTQLGAKYVLFDKKRNRKSTTSIIQTKWNHLRVTQFVSLGC